MFAFVMGMEMKPDQKCHKNIFIVTYNLSKGKIKTARFFIMKL